MRVLAEKISNTTSKSEMRELIESDFMEDGRLDKKKLVEASQYLSFFNKACVSLVLGRDKDILSRLFTKSLENNEPECLQVIADQEYRAKNYAEALMYYEKLLNVYDQNKNIKKIEEEFSGDLNKMMEVLERKIPNFDIIKCAMVRISFIHNEINKKFQDEDYLGALEIVKSGEFKYKGLLLTILDSCIKESIK